MASFSVVSYTYESVTISVSDIVAGNTIRFIVRLEDDPADQTVFTSAVATATSMTRTFSGLAFSTDYACNVDPGDGTGWIGAQYFTTDPPPAIWNGKVYSLPALQTSYALFSWSDWPDSYDALVSGGEVADFEKECWNAIVSKLSNALTTAGDSWNSQYTTAAEAQVTEAYGALSAEMFNSVRYNVQKLVPLAWAWAKRSSFRGYVGREDFKGVGTYGDSAADDVYPEYFKELVRRLNLLIEILRDTADLADILPKAQNLYTDSSIKFYTRKALPVYPKDSFITVDDYCRLRKGKSAPISYQGAVRTDPYCKMRARECARIKLRPSYAVKASGTLSMMKIKRLQVNFGAGGAAYSHGTANVRGVEGYPLTLIGESVSNGTLDLTRGSSAPITILAPVVSGAEVEIVQREPLATAATVAAETTSACTAEMLRAASFKAVGRCKTGVKRAVLGTAWYPPKWVNGGLWIRQSHSVTQNEAGELVIV